MRMNRVKATTIKWYLDRIIKHSTHASTYEKCPKCYAHALHLKLFREKKIK